MSLACWIAITRTQDNRHNFDDIIGGALIGIGMAMASYFMYFPSIYDPSSNKPRMS
jgi:diacylglycerol diphosphate phosphatase / phosphatidate phosphatase